MELCSVHPVPIASGASEILARVRGDFQVQIIFLFHMHSVASPVCHSVHLLLSIPDIEEKLNFPAPIHKSSSPNWENTVPTRRHLEAQTCDVSDLTHSFHFILFDSPTCIFVTLHSILHSSGSVCILSLTIALMRRVH